MNDTQERIVPAANAEFAAAADPAALENAKAKYLGKTGAISEHMKALAKLGASERPAAGARINHIKALIEEALAERRTALADAKLARQLAADSLDVSLPGRGIGHRRPASDHADDRAHRDAVPLARLRGGRRPRDRGRLPQLHRAQHAGGPSVAVDARHVLRRGRTGAAHAHVERADPLHGNARAADQDHRARPRLSRRQRRDALADVPPGRGPVDRRGRDLRRPEGRVHRVPAQLLRARRPRGALPPVVLSVHRALRRDRHELRLGLARDLGRRPGASERAARGRHRSRALAGLRLRDGAGPPRDAALRRRRPARVLRQRPALPAGSSRRRRDRRCNSPNAGSAR